MAQSDGGGAGLREEAGPSLTETLIERLRDRQLLLILDNCEHLIEACAELAHGLLGRCPKLRILATSREVLGVPGEQVWRVPPLALPGAPGRRGGSDAGADLTRTAVTVDRCAARQ